VLVTSGPELDRFLVELSTRRQRILRLTEPPSPSAADLVDELHELSEQLIVADEELRVQQEELDGARADLLALSAERDLLLEHSTKAYVLTDEQGVIVQWTRAARQLVRQPQARLVPRPVATWFEVADRRTVRSLLSRATSGAGPHRAVGLRLLAPGAEPIRVDLDVETITGVDERPLLRWELVPAAARLHALAAPAQEADAGAALALELAATAVELQRTRTRDELVASTRDAALRLVPGAVEADLLLDEGSVAEQPVGHDDGADRALAVPLVVGAERLGVLTVRAEALPPSAEAAVTALGMQVVAALGRLTEVEHLQEAVRAREVVGQAVGILVERRRITPDEAFALLVTWSQDANVKLRTLARTLVETGLEPPPSGRS
jgi:PAS domain-containing protein